MNLAWMSTPFCQVALATAFLGLYLALDTFDDLVSNPLVAYSIMLAFGIAQLTTKRNDTVWARRSHTRTQFAILDLLVYTALVGIVIAHSRARVAMDNRIFDLGGLALPSLFVVWLHWRYRLTPLTASFVHYAISLAWGFSAGFVLYQQHNALYRNDPTRPRFSPMSEGIEWLVEMAEFGIVTSAIYFTVTAVLSQALHIRAFRDEQGIGEQ